MGAKKKQNTPEFCEVCGFDDFVQRHRIVPGREGGKYILGNAIALCGNDHWKADRDIYTRDFLFDIVATRLKKDLERQHITDVSFETAMRYIETNRPDQ